MRSPQKLAAGPIALLAMGLALVGCSSATTPTGPQTTQQVSQAPATPGQTSDLPPAATTVVSASEGGDVSQTVAAPPTASTLTGDVGQTVQPRSGIRLQITKVEATQVTAQGPGEVSGPGVLVHVSVTNDSTETVALSSATVTVTDVANLPAVGMTGPPAAPLPRQVQAGKTVGGVYVFRLQTGSREPLRITVELGQEGVPVVIFTGSPS